MLTVNRNENKLIYTFENDTGKGEITAFEIFPGICVGYNDFHMAYCESTYSPPKKVFCIDHCREGQLEYISGEDKYSYLNAGDIKLDRRLSHIGNFAFPFSHYHGCFISFYIDEVTDFLSQPLLGCYSVDINKLQEKFCPDIYPKVLRANNSIEHIFAELYNVPEKIKLPYLRLKTMELLLFLDALVIPDGDEERPFFYKVQVEKVKKVQQYLMTNIDTKLTQEELAEKFNISLTALKQWYKTVVGDSLGDWFTKYRMNKAASLLVADTDENIASIGLSVGYENPSKFSAAFKKLMKVTPGQYRKENGRE